MTAAKECTRCHQMLPLEKFSKDKTSKDGLCKWCKDCTREYKKQYQKTHAEQNRERASRYYYEHHEECLQKKKVYRDLNRDKINESRRNRPYTETQRKYNQTHRDHINKVTRERYQRNRDQHNEKQREKYANDKRFATQTAIWRHIPDAKERGLQADLTVEDWFDALEYFDNQCAYCGKTGTLEFDHVIPLSKGGGLTRHNIIPSCKSCNSRKYTSDMEVWFRNQDYFSEAQLDKINNWTNC